MLKVKKLTTKEYFKNRMVQDQDQNSCYCFNTFL